MKYAFVEKHRRQCGVPALCEALMLAIPESQAKSWRTEPTLSCLHAKPFITYSPYEANCFFQLVHSCLDREGVKPDIVDHVPQIQRCWRSSIPASAWR